MVDEKFIIDIVLRARDEMSRVLNNASGKLKQLDDVQKAVNQRMDEFNRHTNKMRNELDKLTAQAEKTRRGIRSIGGEDIKIKADIDTSQMERKLASAQKSLQTTTTRLEELKKEKQKFDEEWSKTKAPGWDKDLVAQRRKLEDEIKKLTSIQAGRTTEIVNLHVKLSGAEAARRELNELDRELEKVVVSRERALGRGQRADVFANDIDRITRRMKALGAAAPLERVELFRERVQDSIAPLRQFEGQARRAGTSARALGRDVDRAGNIFERFDAHVHRNRESIAKFDNEIRGMRILLIVSQFQALISVAFAAAGQLTALAGSAITAGSALGGALAAGAAQAVPAIGLLAASIARLKAVFDVVGQIDKARQADATRATSATNAQADATDKLTNASENVADAQKRVADAHRDARRELEDLILTEQRQRLELGESEDQVRQLRLQGVTGFQLESAKLDVTENRQGLRRTSTDLTRATRQGVSGSDQVQQAERALKSARRGLQNARRDINEGGAAQVAAARQLQYLEGRLTNSERHLVRSIQHLRDTWREVSRPITDTIIQSFDRGVKGAEKVLRDPGLGRAFQQLANAGAKQMDRFTRFFQQPEQIAFFTRMTKNLADNLQPAGTAALRLTRAFQNIADAAAPTLHRMVEDIARLARGIENATSNDADLRALFRYGEVQLRAWFDLAHAIGRTIKAIIAPGGDLQSGAAQSGLRSIVDLTERFNKAADWLNSHPLDVAGFFGRSEEVWQRILDLAIELAKVLLDMFDPSSVDAFADIIEALLPSFRLAASAMGDIAKIFAAIFKIPLLGDAMQTAFGFVFLVRILGRFKVLMLGFLGDLTNSVALVSRLATGTSGIGAIWTRNTAAVRGYTAAVEAANVASRTAFVPGRGPQARRGGGPAFISPVSGPQAPAAPPAAGRAAGLVALGGTALTHVGRAARVAGKALLPIGALLAALDFASAKGGVSERSRAAASGATLGIASPDQIRRLADRIRESVPGRGVVSSTLGRIPGIGGIAGHGLLDVLGSSDRDKLRDRAGGAIDKTRGLVKAGDEAGVNRMVSALRRMRVEADKLGDSKLASTITKAANAANKAAEAMDTFTTISGRRLAFDKDDIRSGFWVNDFTRGLERLRHRGVDSVQDLRIQLGKQMDAIRQGFKRGSEASADAMVINFGAGIKAVQKGMKDGKISVEDGMKEIRRITRVQGNFAAKHMEQFSEQGRAAVARNYRRARSAIENNMDDSVEATKSGMKLIRRLLASELEAFGIDPAKARRISKLTSDEGDAFFVAGHGPAPKATGGFVGKMGERGRDAVHTVLGRGEAVLNWAHQKVVNPALQATYGFGLNEMFKRTDGFHAGGIDSPGFARGRGGGTDIATNVSLAGVNAALIKAAKDVFSKFPGLIVTAAKAGHGQFTASGNVSDHFYGNALDIASGDYGLMNRAAAYVRTRWGPSLKQGIHNPNLSINQGKTVDPSFWGASGWAGHADHIHMALTAIGKLGRATKGLTGAVAKQIKRLKVEGSGADSPLGAITQRALDIGVKGANTRLRQLARKFGAIDADTEDGPSGAGAPAPPGQLRSWLAKALRITKHFSQANLSALYGRAIQESTGNPRAINLWDSNAKAGTPSKGLLQTIDPTFNAYKLPGHGNIWNPVDNAIAAIRYMFSRYGHIVGPSSTGYAKGGIIPGALGAARNIIAHAGEWVLNPVQQAKAAIMAGTSPDKLAGTLGFTGGPTSFAGGGIIVGDSLGVGTAEFLKNWKRDVETGRRADEALAILREMLKNNPKARNVVFDAGTNDTDPEKLKQVLKAVVRVAGDRNLLIPTVGGPNAAAKNEVIRSFAGQATILPWRQMAQRQDLLGGDNIHATSQGYQARANAIVDAFKKGGSGGGGSKNLFQLPDFLPPDFKGFASLIGDFFKHVKTLNKKSEGNFKAINANLNLLGQEGGLIDNLAQILEETVTNMRSTNLRRQFAVGRGGIVRQRFGELGSAERELNVLQFEGTRLGRLRRINNRGLRIAQQQLNRIRRGGVDEDEQGIFDDFLTQRRSFRLRRANLRGQIGENLQSRFEAQGGLIESRLGRAIRGPLQRLAASQAGQRVAEAFGRGGQINFIDEQIKAYSDQKPAIMKAIAAARRQKNTQLADSLLEQLRDLDGTIAELTASRLQAQIEQVEASFARQAAFIEFKDRIAAATGTLGLDRIIPGFGGSRRQAFQERGSLLGGQIQQIQVLRWIAASQGNVAALDQLTSTLLDLQAQLQENTRALFLARIEDVNRVAGAATSLAGTRGRISELKATLGIITGPEAQAQQKEQLQAAAAALISQGGALNQLLAEATAAGDEESIINLTQAVADNELAQLENTQALKELDGSLNQTQSFSSTAWEWFRTAIFNGSGGLLPQFAMPTSVGGLGGGIITSPNFEVNGAGGGAVAPNISVEVNEAGQIPDATYYANRIAFAARNLGT